MDNTFINTKKEELKNNHNLISNVFDYVKFTIEKESNNRLSFLGVLITRTNTGKRRTKVYRKPNYTDQILNYGGNNSRIHKINRVQTLVERRGKYTAERKKCLTNIFQKNGSLHKFRNKRQANSSVETKSSTETSKQTILLRVKTYQKVQSEN